METRQVLGQQIHVVEMLPVQNLNTLGATYTDIVSMENYHHLDILFITGGNTVGATATIEVQECDDVTPTTATDIAASYRKNSATDVWRAIAATAAGTGIVMPASTGIGILIPIDSSELSDGYPFVRLAISDPGAAAYGGVYGFLSGPRYAQMTLPTALS